MRQLGKDDMPLPFQDVKHRQRATDDGSFVDRTMHSASPWYGTTGRGGAPDLDKIRLGSSKTPAEMRDKPSSPALDRIEYSKWEYEVCAICKEGKHKGAVYSCLKWGFVIEEGMVTSLPYSAEKFPSGEFHGAIKKWNAQANQHLVIDKEIAGQQQCPILWNPH